ncbi:MAG TPA: HPP family protein [Gemmatimonadales bacterium]|nr:HPP family protein [Gemmatimonadales bacterium]
MLLAPGLAALATGQLLLFPSLAPTAVLQAHAPAHPSARYYNIIVSHVVGMAAAFFAVWLFGVADAPSVFAAHAVSAGRVGAAVLAVALGTYLEMRLHAHHAPAAATTMLVALGSFPATLHSALMIVVGVLVVAAAGEAGRRLHLELAEPDEAAREVASESPGESQRAATPP